MRSGLTRLLAVVCSMCLTAIHLSAQVAPKEALVKMASDKFAERELGYENLKKWSMANMKTSPEVLFSTWKKMVDPEVKTRCYSLMKEVLILRQFGRGRGFVGVRMDSVALPGKPGEAAVLGVRITQVIVDTPGAKAGLMAGDVVLAVDKLDFNQLPEGRLRLGTVEVLSSYIQSKHPGDTITLQIMRAGKKIEKKVTLMLRPPEVDRDPFGRVPENDIHEKKEKYFEDWLFNMSR